MERDWSLEGPSCVPENQELAGESHWQRQWREHGWRQSCCAEPLFVLHWSPEVCAWPPFKMRSKKLKSLPENTLPLLREGMVTSGQNYFSSVGLFLVSLSPLVGLRSRAWSYQNSHRTSQQEHIVCPFRNKYRRTWSERVFCMCSHWHVVERVPHHT